MPNELLILDDAKTDSLANTIFQPKPDANDTVEAAGADNSLVIPLK